MSDLASVPPGVRRPHGAGDIHEAAATWVWTPRDAERDDAAGMTLVRYPARMGGGVRGSRSVSAQRAEVVLNEAITRTRSWGARALTYWTSASDDPDLEAALRARGAAHTDTVEVFALDLTGGLSDEVQTISRGVTVEVLESMAQMRESDAINVAVWGEDALDDAGLRVELAEASTAFSTGTGVRVLARLHDRAVSIGGCVIINGFARLWGAATLEHARGAGAYRAVLAERLRVAQSFGARTALVKGRTATSAPILARAGFTRYGEERAYLLDV